MRINKRIVSMNYRQAIEFLYDSRMMGTKLGLNNIRYLLDKLGNPHRRFSSIHIAGTNGKGSVSAMLSSVLTEAGYTAGLFTSPHLSSFRERIQVGGRCIPEQAVAGCLEQIISIGDKMREMDSVTFPTFFEIVTAIGLWYFAEEGVDAAVVETGMGGRLDATNIVPAKVSVITNIGMEHTVYLGDTIEKIAVEKAGIIKESVPIITAEKNQKALDIIVATARQKCARVTVIDRDVTFSSVNATWDPPDPPCQTLDIRSATTEYPALQMPLIGPHQADNCCIVIAVIEELNRQGLEIGCNAVYSGIAAAVWPGRFETAGSDPAFILDAACNPSAAAALAETLRQILKNEKKIVVVLGFLEDKDYISMCRELLPLAEVTIITQPNNSRAVSASEVERSLKKEFPESEIQVAEDIAGAINVASELALRRSTHICITGSNYLLGEARQALNMAQLQADFILSDNL